MKKLPVLNEREREWIFDRLTQYRKEHGNIGVPELRQRMLYVLDPTDQHYLDQSSLQRFLRGKGDAAPVRTRDEKVLRYQKFLHRAQPPGLAETVGPALAAQMLYPVNMRPKPAIEFEGRYKVTPRFFRPTRKEADVPINEGLTCLMLVSRDERFLNVKLFTQRPGEDVTPHVGAGLFMRCGIDQYLLMTAGFSNASFTLIRETCSDPITLHGVGLNNSSSEGETSPVLELTFTQLAGPRMKPRESSA